MKKNKSLIQLFQALKCLLQNIFKKNPVLFLVLIYLIDLGIRSYQSSGFSAIYLISGLILFISIGIYIASNSFAETTLSFILGVLTIYSIDWENADFTLFILLYFAYIIFIFYSYTIRLSAKQESILNQAACKLNIDDYDNIFRRLKKISQTGTKYNQLSILDRCEIIRYLAFRQVITGEYEDAINVIELIKNVCQIPLSDCCEIYYSFYTYIKNNNNYVTDISSDVQKMFDKVTTLSVSYSEFIYIYSDTKRILVEKQLDYTLYIVEIKQLALKGYSADDIIANLRNRFL